MRRRAPLAVLVALVVGSLAVLRPGPAHAGGPGTWTKIGTTYAASDEVGMFRTADGKLHLVFRKHLTNGHYTYLWSTISLAGQPVGSGTVLSDWETLRPDPRLVPDSSTGMRLVFQGGLDTSGNYFSRGALYTMHSATGASWSLENDTMSQHVTLNEGIAATTETNRTPVASFGLNENLWWHVGLDPSSPAGSGDSGPITGQVNSGLEDNVLVRNQDGSIWLAWFQLFQSKQGYYVAKILPTPGAVTKAPNSGNPTFQDNEPLFSHDVAFAARPGGGLYLAYCVATATKQCDHIDLWKVGSSTARVVPHSGTGNVRQVALAAGPKGRLSVAWYDIGQNLVHAIRTDTTATVFGVDRTIKPPTNTINFFGLQAEGASGRLDIVINRQSTIAPNPIELWHTQILPGLTLTASPSKFSHLHATTVTFAVKDAGQGLPGANVSCIGKHAQTNSSGVAKITFPQGTATGKHVCTGGHVGYNQGKTTITVT